MKTYTTLLLSLLTFMNAFGQADFNLKFWGEIGTSGYIDQPITQIAVGDYHTVAVKNNGTVVEWGANGNQIPIGAFGGKISSSGTLLYRCLEDRWDGCCMGAIQRH